MYSLVKFYLFYFIYLLFFLMTPWNRLSNNNDGFFGSLVPGRSWCSFYLRLIAEQTLSTNVRAEHFRLSREREERAEMFRIRNHW